MEEAVTAETHSQGPDNKANDRFNVRVLAPTEHKPHHFSFQRDALVGDAAAEAASGFGLRPTSPTFELGGTVLDRSQTLEGAGVRNGTELELVDVGGGV
jgi:hypothetical protein